MLKCTAFYAHEYTPMFFKGKVHQKFTYLYFNSSLLVMKIINLLIVCNYAYLFALLDIKLETSIPKLSPCDKHYCKNTIPHRFYNVPK